METRSNMNELSKKMDTAYREGTTSQSAKKKKKKTGSPRKSWSFYWRKVMIISSETTASFIHLSFLRSDQAITSALYCTDVGIIVSVHETCKRASK